MPAELFGETVRAAPSPAWRSAGRLVETTVWGAATSSHGSTADSRSNTCTRFTFAVGSYAVAMNHSGYFENDGVCTSVTTNCWRSSSWVVESRCETSNEPLSMASTGPLSTVDNGLGSSRPIAAFRTSR
jgi:hypothetical protein